MRQLYRNIIKFFLPVLFISYMAGITLFTHSHVVNGVTIVHSHPFKKGTEHNHTTVEFQLLHLLNQVLVTDSGLLPIFVVSVLSLLCILLIRPQGACYCRPPNQSGAGPPSPRNGAHAPSRCGKFPGSGPPAPAGCWRRPFP